MTMDQCEGLAIDVTDSQPERDLPIHPKLGVPDWDAPDTAYVGLWRHD